ncbi:MAG: winged helix-turn-helix domain-containing protein [archaeon]|nr:winged helix-turn-helix domain-containing protein [archaeon]
MVGLRRTRLEIEYDILAEIQKEKKPTKIMYKANLSHSLLKKYLNEFLNNGMITLTTFKKNRKEYNRYTLTTKGLEYYASLHKIVKEFNNLQKQYGK